MTTAQDETLIGPADPFAAPMRGDHALAYGAMAAGVRLVTGYPGAPATPVFDTILAATQPGERLVQWAPNEKVAMEMAIGASLAGQRALVVLKSVGLNIALDPLATFSLSGGFGGLVILLGDDPGGWNSQNEQDTRWLARVADVPIIEPADIAQAANLMVQAYAWSEAHQLPIIVRITGSFGRHTAMVEPPWRLPAPAGVFPRRRGRWVVVPDNVVKRHRTLHRHLREYAGNLASSPYDRISGSGPVGVVAVGHTGAAVRQALVPDAAVSVLSLTSAWPMPEESLIRWAHGMERILVIEEGGPFVEQQLRALFQRHDLAVAVLGRDTRAVPEDGELRAADITKALDTLADGLTRPAADEPARDMPSKVPLCDGCGYRPLLEALVAAMEARGGRSKYIVVGETGCMVRADLPPLELFDVKYSLGASLGMSLGLALSVRGSRVVSLTGDSSFFHTGINALPQIMAARPDLTALILDNEVTALTGGQVHPGSARDERGVPRHGIDIAAVLRAYGIEPVVVTPDDPAAMRAALDAALAAQGPAFIVARVPCPRYRAEEEQA